MHSFPSLVDLFTFCSPSSTDQKKHFVIPDCHLSQLTLENTKIAIIQLIRYCWGNLSWVINTERDITYHECAQLELRFLWQQKLFAKLLLYLVKSSFFKIPTHARKRSWNARKYTNVCFAVAYQNLIEDRYIYWHSLTEETVSRYIIIKYTI